MDSPENTLVYVVHPALEKLPPHLRTIVQRWSSNLIRMSSMDDPEQLSSYLLSTVAKNSLDVKSLPNSDQEAIMEWSTSVEIDQVRDLVLRLIVSIKTNIQHPRMSDTQRHIVLEAQQDVETDFLSVMPNITSWQADTVIKGCVLSSEIMRQTGKRYFPLKWVRESIRSLILGDKPEVDESFGYKDKDILRRDRATDRQLGAIVELQDEVQTDFYEYLHELDSIQADILLKGMVTISEIKRQTGDRKFPLRDVRASIRNFVREKEDGL